jgi:hypothetical protein
MENWVPDKALLEEAQENLVAMLRDCETDPGCAQFVAETAGVLTALGIVTAISSFSAAVQSALRELVAQGGLWKLPREFIEHLDEYIEDWWEADAADRLPIEYAIHELLNRWQAVDCGLAWLDLQIGLTSKTKRSRHVANFRSHSTLEDARVQLPPIEWASPEAQRVWFQFQPRR